jgi:hypothetical protein
MRQVAYWLRDRPHVIAYMLVVVGFAASLIFTRIENNRTREEQVERGLQTFCDASQDNRELIGGILTYLSSRRVANPDPVAQQRFEEFERYAQDRLKVLEVCQERGFGRDINITGGPR